MVTAWRTFRALLGACRLNPDEPCRHCIAGVLAVFVAVQCDAVNAHPLLGYGSAVLRGRGGAYRACFGRVREKPGARVGVPGFVGACCDYAVTTPRAKP